MATSSGNPPKGTLFAIGGGDYEETEPIDRVMLDMAGGRSASVVFVPAASPSRRMGEKFVEYYRSPRSDLSAIASVVRWEVISRSI